MPDLAALLTRPPCAATWAAIVDSLDDDLDPPAADLTAARTAFTAWPAATPRPLPYHWIFRLCAAPSFPPATLATALCLGDRWALHKHVGLEHFTALGETQLERLTTTRDLPALRILDVSCQSDENPYSPGTMLVDVDDLADFLDAPPFANLTALDLSGTSASVDAIAHILAHHPHLRTLALAACEIDGFDDDDFDALLALPDLARLEQLELTNMGQSAAATRTLLASKHLRKLQRLIFPIDRALLEEQELDLREFQTLLVAADLAPAIKTTLLHDYQRPHPSFTPGALFNKLLPGPAGRPGDE